MRVNLFVLEAYSIALPSQCSDGYSNAMNPTTYVKEHQMLWASRHQKTVGVNGYFPFAENEPNGNLFEELSFDAREQFRSADGGELNASGGNPPKMHALHSSSALAINVFHYWLDKDKMDLAQAMEIPWRNIETLEFEKRCPVAEPVDRKAFPKDPNIDVVFRYKSSSIGVESKFGEAYGNHAGLREAYFKNETLWEGLKSCRAFSESVREKASIGLNVAQLLKHTLGLKQLSGVEGFRLVYLWYAAPGRELGEHFRQLEEFKVVLSKDNISFHFMPYQELIVRLAKKVRAQHTSYIDYLCDRYL